MPARAPRPGDVYRDRKSGHLQLFVRTEVRGGTSVETGSGPEDPDYLFVVAIPEHRHFGTRWLRAGEPLPEALELVVNAGADARVEELEAQVRYLEAEKLALAAVMKAAIGALPMKVAAHLRAQYAKARDVALERTA